VPEIKLARLPDRTPIKLSISVPPELHQALSDYAAFYAAAYGQEEPVAELVPAMLGAFLEGDRAFQVSRRARGPNGQQSGT
jgi:hypothetical protein